MQPPAMNKQKQKLNKWHATNFATLQLAKPKESNNAHRYPKEEKAAEGDELEAERRAGGKEWQTSRQKGKQPYEFASETDDI
ncbi:hypothetical protein ACLKA7_014880 [Drosophila subpalustris]